MSTGAVRRTVRSLHPGMTAAWHPRSNVGCVSLIWGQRPSLSNHLVFGGGSGWHKAEGGVGHHAGNSPPIRPPREEVESRRGDGGWLKIEMGPRKGVSGGPTAKGVWLGPELVSPSSAAHIQAALWEQAVRQEGEQVSNKGQMELPLWVGGRAGSAGRAHPWLIWGKPAICWAHTEPSSAEVPPPGKWSFKGGCMPASCSIGKKQGHDAQTD